MNFKITATYKGKPLFCRGSFYSSGLAFTFTSYLIPLVRMLLISGLRYLCYGLLLMLAWSCSSPTPYPNGTTPATTQGSPAALLASDSFYNDTANYHKVFSVYYDSALQKGNFEEAKQLLVNFGRVAYEVLDTNFITTGTQFINHNFPVTIDSSYAMLCHFLSMNHYWEYNYPAMLFWAKKSLASCTQPEADRAKVLAYSDLGSVYTELNKIDTAIYYFLAANEVLTTKTDSGLLAQNYLDIGFCYYRLFATEECKKYFHRSSDIYLALKDTSNYLLNQTYFSLEARQLSIDTISMMKYLDETIAGYSHFFQKNGKDSFYQSLLLCKKYLLQKEYAAAKHCLDVCEKLNSAFPNSYMETDWEMMNLVYEMDRMGQISDEAETIAATDEMRQEGSFSDAADAYGLLAGNAVNKKDFKEAFRFKSLEQELKDTIQQLSAKSRLFEVEKKYQSEKKEQQISLQQKTILSRNTTIALLATSILGIVLAGVALQYRQRQKKLTQEKQNNLNYTRQLLQKTEEERKRIASDLHDSISHELLSLKTTVRTEDIPAVNAKVDIIINDIRIISRNLHPVLFDKIGLQQSIEQLAERVQQQNQFMLTADIEYTPGTLPPASELQVYRMVQEAVTNIIKYAKAIAGKITIRQTTAAVQVEIKDNGKGFPVEETLNSGNAFGLHNLIERSRAIGGETKIASDTGGTVITIHLPKP